MASVAPKRASRRTLIEEIQHYLAVVDVFRALGAQPTWLSESHRWGSPPLSGGKG
jgi:hypothetical protein